MSDFHYQKEADGIAVISWDVAGARINTMTRESLRELASHFDSAFSDGKVRGVVLTSAKKDFSGGMALDTFHQIRGQEPTEEADALFAHIMEFHQIIRRIEWAGRELKSGRSGKPVIAALPGTAVGIGYEIPLACHRIIAAKNPKARIGLPEIKVGLFPAAGGTARLIRRLGIEGAAPLMLKGTLLSPEKALAANLIDAVAEPDELIEKAKEWALGAEPEDIVKPWDRKGYRMPGGTPYSSKGYLSFMGACAMVSGNTSGVYPAVNAMMSAIYEGAQVPFDTALKVEARWFSKLLMEASSLNMLQTLFLDTKALEKGARRPATIKKSELKKIGVVGAGMMGSGIALVSAQAGLEVVLIDQDLNAASRGKGKIEKLLAAQVKRRRVAESETRHILERIKPSQEYETLSGADFVIEAVYENPALKGEVLARIDRSVDCMIASNTSTLPISDLAKSCQTPSTFLGVHFFSPVDRMRLVEIIRGKETDDAAVALAIDFVSRIQKTPIVVNDARFFYANRCVIPYLNEGIRMVGEGVRPPLIENVARQCGMPVGPLQLVDETSIELAVSIAKATKSALGADYGHNDADEVIFKLASLGRLGRKSKAGFFEYSETGHRLRLWHGLGVYFPEATPQPNAEKVRNRLLMIQALEAVRALEEGVLTDVREGNVGAILGWGFAPWSGGPFGWLDGLIANQSVLSLCDDLSRQFGERFVAPKLLVDKATRREKFSVH